VQALDAFLRQATTCGTVPGAVVCVAHRGQVVWHQAYGAAALMPQYRPMQRDTLFDIASLTKVVATTSLVLLAHHEGVCHLGTTRALGWDTPTPGRSSSGDYFSARSIGHLGFTGCSLWIDLAQQVTVVLCTNRVHPTRHAPGITRLRPAVHNLIMRALGVATT
jgi:CubicO group peptidase (beta-lactamase class C family)